MASNAQLRNWFSKFKSLDSSNEKIISKEALQIAKDSVQGAIPLYSTDDLEAAHALFNDYASGVRFRIPDGLTWDQQERIGDWMQRQNIPVDAVGTVSVDAPMPPGFKSLDSSNEKSVSKEVLQIPKDFVWGAIPLYSTADLDAAHALFNDYASGVRLCIPDGLTRDQQERIGDWMQCQNIPVDAVGTVSVDAPMPPGYIRLFLF